MNTNLQVNWSAVITREGAGPLQIVKFEMLVVSRVGFAYVGFGQWLAPVSGGAGKIADFFARQLGNRLDVHGSTFSPSWLFGAACFLAKRSPVHVGSEFLAGHYLTFVAGGLFNVGTVLDRQSARFEPIGHKTLRLAQDGPESRLTPDYRYGPQQGIFVCRCGGVHNKSICN